MDSINLRIEPGQLVGVVGPVGSSKSSLLMAVLREIAPERLAVMGTRAANTGDGVGEVRAARHELVETPSPCLFGRMRMFCCLPATGCCGTITERFRACLW